MASTCTYKEGLVGPIPDQRPEPAPIVFGVRRSHCGLGDGVPLRARLSAKLIKGQKPPVRQMPHAHTRRPRRRPKPTSARRVRPEPCPP